MRAPRKLREQPDLDQLRRQAKELLAAFLAGERDAVAEVNAYYRDANAAKFALHDAQLVIARSYGFESWPKLKAYVDGVNVQRLVEAVHAGDLNRVRAMLQVRPELIKMDMAENNEHRALHYAVLERSPEMVRVLMEHGADARKGIWPYRGATSAFAIASERGYSELVAIIENEEGRRRETKPVEEPETDSVAQAAVIRGDAEWVRAHHAEFRPSEGLLSTAVEHDRLDMLELLLDLGLDPDERVRLENIDEVIHSWGRPLHVCAGTGRMAMAEMLLKRGADPNGKVYASGTPVGSAYGERDWDMLKLLVSHGGVVYAENAGYYRDTELARQLIADEAAGRLREGVIDEGASLAETLLGSGASGGDPEIVRMALERLDWSRDDPRWQYKLWEARCFWNHIPWIQTADATLDRGAYLTCFRLILDRYHANGRGSLGRTLLHDVAAMGDWVTDGEVTAFARTLLNAGARMDVRDDLLKSTPLGWACRWGRLGMVRLLLAHGADPAEADAEPWATPRAWAEKMGRPEVLAALQEH